MRYSFLTWTSAVAVSAFIGCGPKPVANDAAPKSENVVFAFEFGMANLSWRTDSHQVMIGFTDELNQSEKGVDKWTVSRFCARLAEQRASRTAHMVWSGEVTGGKPQGQGFGDGKEEDPFDVATCSGGTTKAISSNASDLDLSTLPVTKALTGSALVEYLSDTPDQDNTVSVVIKTETADGEITYTHKQAAGTATQTVPSTANSDIPADSMVAVPTPTLNNLKPKATFSQVDGNPRRIKVNFLGLTDPTTGESVKLVANETIFLGEGSARLQKGLKVTQSDAIGLPVDVLFTVDNSGSMGEEADKIADKISDFAAALVKSGVDARFAVVGFNGGITGARDFTDVSGVESYLGRGKGTMRTGGFEGDNGSDLETKAGTFDIEN